MTDPKEKINKTEHVETSSNTNVDYINFVLSLAGPSLSKCKGEEDFLSNCGDGDCSDPDSSTCESCT